MVVIREATRSDISALLALQDASYPTLSKFSAWRQHHLVKHQEAFPEGQLVAETGKRIVGFSASFITSSSKAFQSHSFREITGHWTFSSHNPEGDVLYGAEIVVHPDFRGQGVGRLLYAARFNLAQRLGLSYFVAGGRVPGYAEVSARMGIRDYVRSVIEGERVDRVLTPQLRNGLRVAGILTHYLSDPKSVDHATLLVWENPTLVTSTARLRQAAGVAPPVLSA